MAELKFEIGAQLIKQFGEGIAYLIGRFDKRSSDDIKNSTSLLLRSIAMAAGQEEALANMLDRYLANPEMAKYQTDEKLGRDETRKLNMVISEIEETFVLIKKTMRDLDPVWVAYNPGTIANIGTFAHDGVLAYFTNSGTKVLITDKVETIKIVRALREEALLLRQAAEIISASSKLGVDGGMQ